MKKKSVNTKPWEGSTMARTCSIVFVTVLLFSPSIDAQPGCLEPPAGLVHWWPGDGNALDIAGTRNGVLDGVTFTAGKVGQGFSFDGNDAVDLPGVFGGGPELTIGAWVKTTVSTGFFEAVVSSDAFEYVHLQLRDGIGNIGFYTTGGPFFVDFPLIGESPTGVFRHVAISIKSADSRLFLDGNQVASNNAMFDTVTPTSTLRIGSGIGAGEGLQGRFFQGVIDEVEIFDRALSAAEIKAIFDADSAGKCRDPIDLIAGLIGDVLGLNVAKGITNSLDAKLGSALDSIQDINENNDVAAINKLQAFINAVEAQRGKELTDAEADALRGAAQAIIDLLAGS